VCILLRQKQGQKDGAGNKCDSAGINQHYHEGVYDDVSVHVREDGRMDFLDTTNNQDWCSATGINKTAWVDKFKSRTYAGKFLALLA